MKGQPLDASKYYIVLPDGIGHGESSKPSDGLRARFPYYDYDDMVRRRRYRGRAVSGLPQARAMRTGDANDMLYQYEASRNYDPAPSLEKIDAPLLAVNSADDELNPPELGILEREIKRVPKGRYPSFPQARKPAGGPRTCAPGCGASICWSC